MKNSYVWVIIALLLGFSVFGILKSLELSARNIALGNSLHALEKELVLTQKSLTSTRKVLGESYLKNAELEGRLIVMDKKVASQVTTIKAYLAKISGLSSKLQETARANAFFSARNQEIAHELLAEKLAADDMRKKLSSIPELKKAIKELRTKVKNTIKIKPAEVIMAPLLQSDRNKFVKLEHQKPLELIYGNEGYLTKEGKSTYSGWVDVSVVVSGPVHVSQ